MGDYLINSFTTATEAKRIKSKKTPIITLHTTI